MQKIWELNTVLAILRQNRQLGNPCPDPLLDHGDRTDVYVHSTPQLSTSGLVQLAFAFTCTTKHPWAKAQQENTTTEHKQSTDKSISHIASQVLNHIIIQYNQVFNTLTCHLISYISSQVITVRKNNIASMEMVR